MQRCVNSLINMKKRQEDDLITEPSTYTTKEWNQMLGECLEKHITIWELWGEEYDKEAEY